MFVRILSLLVALTLALPASAMTDDQKKEIQAVVRQYILDNPEILFEAADLHQKKQEEAANKAAEKVLKERADELFKGQDHRTLGNKKAKTVFVEFFDYNCGYCKKAFTDLQTLTDKNQDIKVVLIDTPILGPSSFEAAKWSVAAAKLGKFTEFHTAAMKFMGPKTEEALVKIATEAGLDSAKMKEQAAKDETAQQIAKNMELFSALGLSGTPAFAAPDRVIRGFVGPEVLEQIAKELQTAKTP